MPITPTVLLVDDDEAARYLSSRLLRRLGLEAQVNEATNGSEALALLQAACNAGQPLPTLILLDLNMPVLNGFELLTRLAELPAACRQGSAVIVLSSTEQPNEIAAVSSLATEFVSKPLTEATLLRLLRQYAGYTPPS